MSPNEAARQIGTELGQSNAKGDERLAAALAQPTTQHTEVLCVKDQGSMWPTLYVEGTSVRVGDVEGTSATGGNAVATAHRLALCWNSHDAMVDRISVLCACLRAACAYPATAHAWDTWKAEIEKAEALTHPTPPNVPPVSP